MNKTRFGSIMMVGLLLLSLSVLNVPLTTGQTATPGPLEEPMVTVRLFNRTVLAYPYSRAEVLGVFPRRSTVPVTAITEDGRWWQVPYPTGPGGYGYMRTRWTRPNAAANNVPRIWVVFATPEPGPGTPTPTPAPPRPTAVPCIYNSAFVADVTIPDNTVVPPAQAFHKVWRVMNTGTCTWGPGTVLVFIRGSEMNGQSGSPVPQALPGATVDIGLTLFAPSAPGRYTGVWRLMDPKSRLFGPELTVVIQVPSGAPPPPPPTPTATPLPARSVNFWADTYRVDPGQCTECPLDYHRRPGGIPGVRRPQLRRAPQRFAPGLSVDRREDLHAACDLAGWQPDEPEPHHQHQCPVSHGDASAADRDACAAYGHTQVTHSHAGAADRDACAAHGHTQAAHSHACAAHADTGSHHSVQRQQDDDQARRVRDDLVERAVRPERGILQRKQWHKERAWHGQYVHWQFRGMSHGPHDLQSEGGWAQWTGVQPEYHHHSSAANSHAGAHSAAPSTCGARTAHSTSTGGAV